MDQCLSSWFDALGADPELMGFARDQPGVDDQDSGLGLGSEDR